MPSLHLGFRVQGLGSRVLGLGFRVSGVRGAPPSPLAVLGRRACRRRSRTPRSASCSPANTLRTRPRLRSLTLFSLGRGRYWSSGGQARYWLSDCLFSPVNTLRTGPRFRVYAVGVIRPKIPSKYWLMSCTVNKLYRAIVDWHHASKWADIRSPQCEGFRG